MRHRLCISAVLLAGLSACTKKVEDKPLPDIRITEIKEEGAGPEKLFSVAIQAKPGFLPEANDLRVMTYIYEQRGDGEIVLSNARVIPNWLTPPIDWKSAEGELLQLKYPGPKSEDNAKFYGYVIGIYHKGKLQDFRTQPAAFIGKVHLPVLQ